MLVLQTVVHETLWGGKKLTMYSNSKCERIGHLYSVHCNACESNMILNGVYRGKPLNEYFDWVKVKYGLDEYKYFPVTIALVEAKDNLSIQVHPDDEAVAVLDPEMKRGKNESWFFIDAPLDGEIYNGCRCKSMNELRQAIAAGKMEEAADKLQVRKGDYVYVEAGTLHAMASGSLVYEIEENGGCTYRFFDFDRIGQDGKKRELQIPEAFYSIHLENKSETRRYGRWPIEERIYSTQYYESISNYKNESRFLQVFTILSGQGTVEDITVKPGMSIILEPEECIEMDRVEAIAACIKG